MYTDRLIFAIITTLIGSVVLFRSCFECWRSLDEGLKGFSILCFVVGEAMLIFMGYCFATGLGWDMGAS
jgi:hypothetical protein